MFLRPKCCVLVNNNNNDNKAEISLRYKLYSVQKQKIVLRQTNILAGLKNSEVINSKSSLANLFLICNDDRLRKAFFISKGTFSRLF